MEYSSNGKGNLGVTLGAIGTGLGALNGLGNMFGFGNNVAGGMYNGHAHRHNEYGERYVDRYEAAQAARISELETEVKLRDANVYTLGEVNKLRNYMENRFDRVEHELCDQKAYNAANNVTLGCIQNQITQLYGLAKLVVPNSAICPGFGEVTVTPATTTTTTTTTPAA